MWMIHARELDGSVVEIKYNKWFNGTGYHDHTIYLETKPSGNWSNIIFEEDTQATVIDFLRSMVDTNIDVQRKIAQLSLEKALQKFELSHPSKIVRIMNATCLLDTTFTPPVINEGCGWQIELLHNIVNMSFGVINTCRNMKRLDRYSRTLELL